MGYWITFVHPEPGLSALQTLEWQNAQYEHDTLDLDSPPPQIALTDEQLAGWERICERMAVLAGEVDREDYPDHLGIASDHPRIRLEYVGDSASIQIPYWYDGESAVQALALAYAVGRIVEDETELVGVDSQTGAGLGGGTDAAVELYVATRLNAVSAIAERDRQPDADRQTIRERWTRLRARRGR